MPEFILKPSAEGQKCDAFFARPTNKFIEVSIIQRNGEPLGSLRVRGAHDQARA